MLLLSVRFVTLYCVVMARSEFALNCKNQHLWEGAYLPGMCDIAPEVPGMRRCLCLSLARGLFFSFTARSLNFKVYGCALYV